ncbi:MAG: CapA family protein [Oligoflexia bacterium]|nr:CapA family protein [Oligoflexia bacterium]
MSKPSVFLSLFGFVALFISTNQGLYADSGKTFRRACDRGDTITIAAVGDVLLHSRLQQQAYASSEGHRSLWRSVEPLLQSADIAYANLEGPVAPGVSSNGKSVKDPGKVYDNIVYSGYPNFNYHKSLASDLKSAGFDIVSTANNHSLDRGSVGVDRTIDVLDAVSLPYTGTRKKSGTNKASHQWSVVTQKAGWKIAWIACSFSTNGKRDSHGQVLGCFSDEGILKSEIQKMKRVSDAVIVTPHWGEKEGTHVIEKSQRALAKRLANAGATAILGNHPHVLKPWEVISTDDGRDVFVIYSIGNFVSNQTSLAQRTSAIVYIGLTKSGSDAWVNGMTYVPTYMFKGPYQLAALDRTSRAPRESLSLSEKYLGSKWRTKDSTNRIITNPDCR